MAENVFTPDEVFSLNGYQQSGSGHPFTCGGGHRTEQPDGEGILVATVRGWVCPYCDYQQDWARPWMKDGSWRTFSTVLALAESSAREEIFLKPLQAAYHALRSYQYGNSATDLAEEAADVILKAFQTAGFKAPDF